jgi:FlaA1/EpsC-like NDP-sugar epimerase
MNHKDDLIDRVSNGVLRFRFIIVVVIHLAATVGGYIGAFLIRFDFDVPVSDYTLLYITLPYLIMTRMAAYLYFNCLYVSFLHSGLKDYWGILKAQVVGTILFLTIIYFLRHLDGFSRSVFIIEFLLTLSLLFGVHFIRKLLIQLKDIRLDKPKKNVLIVGAGTAGVMIMNEYNGNDRLDVSVVGFVDDNPYKLNTYIQGVPVLGNRSKINHLIEKHNVDEVIVAVPSAPYKEIMEIARSINDDKVDVRVLPGFGTLIEEGNFLGQLNNISIDTLIGRKTIKFSRESDRKEIEKDIRGNVILVSGAGGSIGSELCSQIIEYKPKTLIALERHEGSLYDIEISIRKEYPDLNLIPIIGDVRDTKKMDRIFSEYGISEVYHAAAYKHVPMMEREIEEAVKNNIFGTLCLMNKSIEYKTGKFVLISTDKAVNPTSIMGATKRAAELVLQSHNANGSNGSTKFISVRFGNVLESSGSVIPLFKKQIAQGGPVTVTHKDVTRYFMSIPEAVQLVMTAGSMGKGGEIFLLDMGEPVHILDLAKKLIRQAGFEVGRDIEIVISGLRKGEKLHEELFWKGDGVVPTENKKITMLKPGGNRISDKELAEKIALLSERIERNDGGELLDILREIVPEARIGENHGDNNSNVI